MKKRTLLSLLAIPVFSVATTFNSFSQDYKQIGAGVIDFLLANPKTANKMKPSESAALYIIGDFLKAQSQREHELEVAVAGKDEITFNVDDGRQVQFVKDGSGNIFLVIDGVIHPIAKELINQARSIPSTSIDNATLPPYNLRDLESKFNSNPTEDISQYYKVSRGGEYLSDIAKKFDVSKSNVYWIKGKHFYPITDRRTLADKCKLGRFGGYPGNLWIVKEKYRNEISTVFSYKWHRDLNNDGSLNFNEFNQIKRTFYSDEDFYIATKFQIDKSFKGSLELKIFDDYTGNLVSYEEWENVPSEAQIAIKDIPAGALPKGVYLIHTNLIDNNSTTVSSKSERFEIIPKTTE